MPPHLQDGRTPLMVGITKKAVFAVALLLDKMRALGLGEDAVCALDSNQCNALHHAAQQDMGDTVKTLLNANEAHAKAALAAKNTVLSRTTMLAVPMTVCASADNQAAEPARACSTMPPEHATCGCNQSYVCVLRL